MNTQTVPDSVLGSATITREQSMAIGAPTLLVGGRGLGVRVGGGVGVGVRVRLGVGVKD